MASSLDETTLADTPAVLTIQDQLERDEQEEWEYEYSTTETETYYLTLELSYPEFKDRQSRAPHHSRGGYYKNWLDHNPSQMKGIGGRNNQADNDDDNDNEPLPEPEADDDEPEIDPELNNDDNDDNDKGKGVDARDAREEDGDKNQDNTEDIQILELHSENPVIAYKGRVFEGQWAEIIGTEAIFAVRDNENPLPALRRLDGNIDFLGACASRITTTENLVKPKISREDPLAAIREEWNIRIPVGKDRSGERAQQTRFLENLIALKKQKGETDQVTVWAKDGEGKDFKDNRDPDYKPRRRRRMFNEDGEEVIPKRERRRGTGRKIGRPRGRGRGRRATSTAAPTSTRGDLGSSAQEGALSTPTPSRWNDLFEREDDGMEDDEDNDNPSETDNDDDDDDGDTSMAD